MVVFKALGQNLVNVQQKYVSVQQEVINSTTESCVWRGFKCWVWLQCCYKKKWVMTVIRPSQVNFKDRTNKQHMVQLDREVQAAPYSA